MKRLVKTTLHMGLCLLLLGGATVGADDWPNWRGPDRNGISQETAWRCDWPDTGPPILWRKSLGMGFSSIAVSGGRAYTMGSTGRKGDKKEDEHRDVVWCFDAATGREVWRQSYRCPLEPKWYEGGPSATPTVSEGRVYTVSKQGHVLCFDAATGSAIWQKHLNEDYGVKPPEWGFAGSAVILGDTLILNAGTHGLALAQSDGALVWVNAKGPAGYASAVPYVQAGRQCVALLGGKEAYGVAVDDGELLWRQPWKTNYDENIPDVLISGNRLFVSTGLGSGAALFEMGEDGLSQLWRHKKFETWLNGAVLWKGHVYGVNTRKPQTVACLDFETGAVKWSHPGVGDGSLMLADGKLIILSDKGRLAVAAAVPEGYAELATAEILTGKCWTVPVLANGRIYARNAEGDMVCVDVRGGR